MKVKAIYLVLTLIACGLYAQEKSLVTTDVLNVRDAPSLNGQVVQKYEFGDIVYIFCESGSGEILNNELDLWYKISETGNVWVNALYIKKFPFFIKSEAEDILYRCVLKIEDCITENTKKYLTGRIVYGPEAGRVKPLGNITLELDYKIPVFDTYINVLDNNYNNLQELSNGFANVASKEMYEELAASYNELSGGKYQTSNFSVEHSRNRGIIQFTLFTQKYTFKYGIRVGRNVNYIKRILGEPYRIDGNKLTYQTFTRINESIIIFDIDNDIITNITWILQI
jgi:hypothetical protein